MDITNIIALMCIHTHIFRTMYPRFLAIQRLGRQRGAIFKQEGSSPTLTEIAAYYRARNLACVVFPVDAESTTGEVRVPNEDVAEAAAENPDVLIPFASIDPAKGKMGALEARRLIEQFGVCGFKFHPTIQQFYPNDPKAYVLYEVIAEAGLSAIFHTGHSGIGTGVRGGGGIRLKYSNPMYLDDAAVDFPDMPIISLAR